MVYINDEPFNLTAPSSVKNRDSEEVRQLKSNITSLQTENHILNLKVQNLELQFMTLMEGFEELKRNFTVRYAKCICPDDVFSPTTTSSVTTFAPSSTTSQQTTTTTTTTAAVTSTTTPACCSTTTTEATTQVSTTRGEVSTTIITTTTPVVSNRDLFSIGGFYTQNTRTSVKYDGETFESVTLAALDRGDFVLVHFRGTVYAVGSGSSVMALSSNALVWINVATLNSHHNDGAAVVYHNSIYVIGGSSSNTCEKVNVDHSVEPCPGLSNGRNDITAVVYQDKIFVIGGRRNTVTTYNTVEVFDGVSWATHTFPQYFYGLKSIIFQGHIFACGGYDISDRIGDDCFYYNEIDEWIRDPELTLGYFGQHSLQVFHDEIYIIGGEDEEQRVEKWKGPGNTWELVTETTPNGLRRHSSVVFNPTDIHFYSFEDMTLVCSSQASRNQVTDSGATEISRVVGCCCPEVFELRALRHSLEITKPFTTFDVGKLENIQGDFNIENNELTSISFNRMLSVSGSIKLSGNPGLTAVEFPYLEYVGGDIDVRHDHLTIFSLFMDTSDGRMRTIVGDLLLSNNTLNQGIHIHGNTELLGSIHLEDTRIMDVSLGDITYLKGDVILPEGFVSSFNFGKLLRIDGTITFQNLLVTSLDLTGVRSFWGPLSVQHNQYLTHVTLGNTLQLVENVAVTHNNDLISVKIPTEKYLEITQKLTITDNMKLKNITLGTRTGMMIRSDVIISNNPELDEMFYVPTTIIFSGNFVFTNNNNLELLVFPQALSVRYLTITSNAKLTTFQFDELRYVYGNADLSNNPNLAAVTFGKMVRIDGFLDVRNTALDYLNCKDITINCVYASDTVFLDNCPSRCT